MEECSISDVHVGSSILKGSVCLPDGYSDSNSYVRDVLAFLSKYRWVFNFPVTRLLEFGVLDSVPVDWVETLFSLSNEELNNIPNGLTKETWPESLQEFCKLCQVLKLPVNLLSESNSAYDLPQDLDRGLSPKKRHEVKCLAALIHKECSSRGINKILDVGSGLGYLDLVLYHKYGYEVLGLESSLDHVEKAEARRQGLHISHDIVSYLHCEVSAASEGEIHLALQERLLGGADGVCLVGLHCCGDLTASSTDLFLSHPALQLLIVVPCCYHKMSLMECRDEEECFNYFPQSECLKRTIDSVCADARTFLCRPFLRLASQQTCTKWKQRSEEDHRKHGLNLMARTVLYLYANNGEL